MHPSDGEAPLWSLVRELEWWTVEEWRKKFYPGTTRDGIFALHLTCLETTVCRRGGGNILVTVSILAKKAFECEVRPFHLQRAGNRMYKVVSRA